MKNQAMTCGTHQPQEIQQQLVSSERLRGFDGKFMNVVFHGTLIIGICDPKTEQVIFTIPELRGEKPDMIWVDEIAPLDGEFAGGDMWNKELTADEIEKLR